MQLFQERDKILALDEHIRDYTHIIVERPRQRRQMQLMFDDETQAPAWLKEATPDLADECTTLFGQLEDYRKKKTSTLVTQNLCLAGTSWEILSSKNPARDYKPLVQAAIVESALVNNYRRKLLEYCPPSIKLRDIIRNTLSAFSTKTAIVKQDKGSVIKTGMHKEWNFPDGIVCEPRSNLQDRNDEE